MKDRYIKPESDAILTGLELLAGGSTLSPDDTDPTPPGIGGSGSPSRQNSVWDIDEDYEEK